MTLDSARNYSSLFATFVLIVPTAMPTLLWDEPVALAAVFSLWRYCTALHCTWFVNSAAHMWGDRPYNKTIEPRENLFVSYGAFGEGYHNYHHSFPWDYSTGELGSLLNPSKYFIDAMAFVGSAYDLKRASRDMLRSRKEKTSCDNQEDRTAKSG